MFGTRKGPTWHRFDGLSINLNDLAEIAALLRDDIADPLEIPVFTGTGRVLKIKELEDAGPRDLEDLLVPSVDGRPGHELTPRDGVPVVILRIADMGLLPWERRKRERLDEPVELTYAACLGEEAAGGAALVASVSDMLEQRARRRHSWAWAPWLVLGGIWLGVAVSLVVSATARVVPWLLMPTLALLVIAAGFPLYLAARWAQTQLLLRIKGTEVRLSTHRLEREKRDVQQTEWRGVAKGVVATLVVGAIPWVVAAIF